MSTSYTAHDQSHYDDEELMFMQLQSQELETMALLLALDDSERKRARLISKLAAIRGQVITLRKEKKRNRRRTHDDLWEKYFSADPIYSDADFRRRFRMRRSLFDRILQAVCEHDDYFVLKNDAAGRPGLTPHLKIVACLRYICYGASMDSYDESYAIGKSTAYKSLRRFCKAIIEIYSGYYLREPTPEDVQRITTENAARGFPGMLGSIDCMHWQWASCAVEDHGAFRGRSGDPTVILEAVATRDTWVWKSFFGMPGSNNDINVLSRSPVFEDILRGRMPSHSFVVNGHEYHMGYYLADGIYPEYATFVKSKKNPTNLKEKIFAKAQEAARKDIERTFGILQKRFAILANPARLWSIEDLTMIVEACIIMHNMIVEDERHTNLPTDYEAPLTTPGGGLDRDPHFLFTQYLSRNTYMRDKPTHRQLHEDLKEHMFNHNGQQQFNVFDE